MSFLRKQESISLWIALSSTAMTGRPISFLCTQSKVIDGLEIEVKGVFEGC